MARAPAARGARGVHAGDPGRQARRGGRVSLQTAQRELAEEIGREAEDWQEVRAYYPSSGYSDELVHIFAATGLREVDAEADPGERITIVPWPLADLDAALAETDDAKTVIGLQWLRAMLG